MKLTSYTISRTDLIKRVYDIATDVISDMTRDIAGGCTHAWEIANEQLQAIRNINDIDATDLCTLVHKTFPWIIDELFEANPDCSDILLYNEKTKGKITLASGSKWFS